MITPGKELTHFEGNTPGNVSGDAKYSVRYDSGDHVVGMVYRTAFREEWRPVTSEHPKLVEMVNAVKLQATGQPGGAFYINEYQQVIVPVVGASDYYLAGEYGEPLEFEFEGHIISGDARSLDGESLQPGDSWEGPHPGIPYILKAGARDIYYEQEVRPRVFKKPHLSDYQSKATVRELCQFIARIKGYEGGRFYINEFQQLFAPYEGERGLEYFYIGKLPSLDDWFPKPHKS